MNLFKSSGSAKGIVSCAILVSLGAQNMPADLVMVSVNKHRTIWSTYNFEEPPRTWLLSTRTHLTWEDSLRAMAAERPDMPPPMMTISVSIRSGVGAMVSNNRIVFVKRSTLISSPTYSRHLMHLTPTSESDLGNNIGKINIGADRVRQ